MIDRFEELVAPLRAAAGGHAVSIGERPPPQAVTQRLREVGQLYALCVQLERIGRANGLIRTPPPAPPTPER